jgi:hypothetical protein
MMLGGEPRATFGETKMLFNDILVKQGIDNASVLVFRHTPEEGKLREVFPWLADEHPNVFNAYQSTQTRKVEAAMLKAKYVASNENQISN